MRADCRAGGFTLIEVLVALAIVGLALAGVAGVLGNGLIGHETASGAENALALAEERLATTATPGALRPGTSKGTYAERFTWQTSVALYDDGGSEAKAFDRKPGQPQLYRIAVTVAWRDGHRERQIALTTLLLGSAPP